jgi:cell division inhibitor SepF
MATMWRRAMTYLGLGPDEEYDDYDEREAAPQREREPAPVRSGRPRQREPEPESDADVAYVGSVRRLEAQPVEPTSGAVAVSTQPKRASTPVVRAIPSTPSAKPYVLAPGSFNDAQDVGDKYKSGVPVIINLQNVDRDLQRRIIDFASGLCYGLGGNMERVAHQVYLLTPSNVEVSAEERRRLQERGLYD